MFNALASLTLLLSIVLSCAAKIVSREATNWPVWTHCKRYRHDFQGQRCSCPLSEAVVQTELMLTSNEQSVIVRTMTNGDLCDFLRSSVTFSLKRAKKNSCQYKCHRTQYFEDTLQYKFQYSYITAASKFYNYIAIYVYPCPQHEAIRWAQNESNI